MPGCSVYFTVNIGNSKRLWRVRSAIGYQLMPCAFLVVRGNAPLEICFRVDYPQTMGHTFIGAAPCLTENRVAGGMHLEPSKPESSRSHSRNGGSFFAGYRGTRQLFYITWSPQDWGIRWFIPGTHIHYSGGARILFLHLDPADHRPRIDNTPINTYLRTSRY